MIDNVPTVPDPSHALGERIKELNCLYGISKLLETQDVSLAWILSRAVELIPAALQYPEKACACIKLDDEEYISTGFKRTSWCRTMPVMLNGQHVGDLEVFYTEPMLSDTSALFLEEESHLLQAISERLSRVLWLKQSEAALKESEERYRLLTEQVTDGVTLVQDLVFCYVNPAFCRIFDIPLADRLIDQPVHKAMVGRSDEIGLIYGLLSDSIPLKTIQEIHQLDRSEKVRWVQVCHSPITFKGRRAVLSTFNDVTEMKEQQVAAQHLADQLQDENRILRSSLKERYRFGDILGRSPLMQEVYELILKAASTDASVTIFGESGSGKELVAQAIHRHSQRKVERFVAVNCSAIQESLFEREFFGHRKGAFSSAHVDAPGYLDLADHGTLFLDEVTELTLNMQAKLLRAMEGGGYRPIGATETVISDFRIISASNASLGEKVRAGRMRDDFFYRLQVIRIQLPPLRDRKQDIPLLVDHFLQKMTTAPPRVPGHIIDILLAHDWPGNVRELRNVMQRYLTLGRLEFLSPTPDTGAMAIPSTLNLQRAMQQLQSALVDEALKQCGGNRTRAAALLGISRRALFRKTAAVGCHPAGMVEEQ